MTEQHIIELINQLFEIEKKKKQFGYEKLDRNLDRLKYILEELGYRYKDPTGEQYDETRIDCQATILNEADPLIISDTVKPIVFSKDNVIVQQARVIIQ